MSDGMATRRRGLTKTHKRILGAAGSIAVVVSSSSSSSRRSPTTATSSTSCAARLAGLGAARGAVVLNIATFPPPWMAASTRLGYRDAMAMTQASTALSIVSPAGAAVGMGASYSMLRAWKYRLRPSLSPSPSRGSGTSS
jgi:hypothetical protein